MISLEERTIVSVRSQQQLQMRHFCGPELLHKQTQCLMMIHSIATDGKIIDNMVNEES